MKAFATNVTAGLMNILLANIKFKVETIILIF